ncbi:hypothetical protein CPB84DRAFT_1754334 [Gymnopilus junonius]|uniref:Uncharacterized protein n=1 Tax=Gymnopilus junonius TaxID=109634 RepID=A0A9P5N8M6_GYMJU|nr:hypothetical protein CPB84DRAFT_1754334 [Gymnopilus junonius]
MPTVPLYKHLLRGAWAYTKCLQKLRRHETEPKSNSEDQSGDDLEVPRNPEPRPAIPRDDDDDSRILGETITKHKLLYSTETMVRWRTCQTAHQGSELQLPQVQGGTKLCIPTSDSNPGMSVVVHLFTATVQDELCNKYSGPGGLHLAVSI